MTKKELSRPYPFLEEKKRKLIRVDRALYNKVKYWKTKKFILENCEIVDKNESE